MQELQFSSFFYFHFSIITDLRKASLRKQIVPTIKGVPYKQYLFVLDYQTLILAPHPHKTIILTYLPIQLQKFLDQQVEAPSLV